MSLIVSTIGVDSGLLWEQNLNTDLSILDGHNHSPGNGVPIGANGINLSTALPFNNNAATSLQACIFTNQLSLSTLNALYTINGELYFNDTTGVVQLTLGGAVNATSSGIVSGSATASFVSSVLVVNEASNTPANIQVGSVLIGNNLSASNFVTLSVPSPLAASYVLTLPTAENAVLGDWMTADTVGNFSWTGVDNSTLQYSSNVISVKPLGITAAQIANNTITRTKEAAVGQQISSSSGTYSTSLFGPNPVTNMSVTITTSGRPVVLMIQPDGTTNPASYGVNPAGSGATSFSAQINRGGSSIAKWTLLGYSAASGFITPGGANIMFLDTPASGTYTYQFLIGGLNPTFVNYMVLVAYEL